MEVDGQPVRRLVPFVGDADYLLDGAYDLLLPPNVETALNQQVAAVADVAPLVLELLDDLEYVLVPLGALKALVYRAFLHANIQWAAGEPTLIEVPIE